jgi:branched-chain amino acid aminotransferase
MFVWFNGQVMPEEEARVSPLSRGWLVGEGVFETMVWREGKVEALHRHWLRLCDGARLMGLPAPSLQEMVKALESVVMANDGYHRLRYTVSRGVGDAVDHCAVATPLTPWPEQERVVVVPWQRNAGGALTGIKSVAYAENVRALHYARERGCGEGLFLNTAGQLCEGSGSNVFFVVNDRLLTPPLASGCLPGVTRALVLESGLADESNLSAADLLQVREMFLTSSTRGVQAVAVCDEIPLPVINGEWTREARGALAQALSK